jgi:hypothetical protein
VAGTDVIANVEGAVCGSPTTPTPPAPSCRREPAHGPGARVGVATRVLSALRSRLKNAPIRQVVVSNSLPIPPEKHFDTLKVLSIAPTIAEAIGAVFEDTSVSEIFRGDNL